MNTYNSPTFGVVALVILVFVGVGALTYYAVDLTQNYYELLDDLAVARNQAEALKNENETLKKLNADKTNRINELEAEKMNLTGSLQILPEAERSARSKRGLPGNTSILRRFFRPSSPGHSGHPPDRRFPGRHDLHQIPGRDTPQAGRPLQPDEQPSPLPDYTHHRRDP